MTDTPALPPTPLPPSLPQEARADQPRIWLAALLFVAFGTVAGGSCVASESSNLWVLLFILSMPLASGAFALFVFRLWRRRVAESWPSLGQAALLALAGAGLAVGGCGGLAMTIDASALLPIAVGLGAVFVLGTALVIGAGELFLIAIARLMVAPRR